MLVACSSTTMRSVPSIQCTASPPPRPPTCLIMDLSSLGKREMSKALRISRYRPTSGKSPACVRRACRPSEEEGGCTHHTSKKNKVCCPPYINPNQ